MVPWKRILGWVLCVLVGIAVARSESQANDLDAGAAAPGGEPQASEVVTGAPVAGSEPDAIEAEASAPAAGGESLASEGEGLDLGEAALPTSPMELPSDEGTPANADPGFDAEAVPADGADLDPALAGETTIEPAAVEDALGTWEAEAAPAPPAMAAPAPSAGDPTATHPPLGAVGYDSSGREGRIHIVARGDTLWDISEAYLGTPWVWPSIWKDNGEIENPHLIHPGDRIWITPTEMRRISAEEAETLISNVPEEALPDEEQPAAPAEQVPEEQPEAFETALAVPAELSTYSVPSRETAGLISPEQLKSAASIVAGVPDRVFMSQEDQVYIGLGESEVEPGDEFTLFRTRDKVFDPDTGRLLGYHVDFLGWVRVQKTFPETSLVSIRMSTGEVEEGDRLMPREPLPPEIEIQAAPAGVEGKISYFPNHRVLMGFQDFVYLNRGTLDGLEIGSPLEVYRSGYGAKEVARAERVEVPDRVVAKLLVVRATTDSSVAIVTTSDTELELGDRFRGATE